MYEEEKDPPFRGYCSICEEPIEWWEEYYLFPGQELVCENCVDDWVRQFHHYGEEYE